MLTSTARVHPVEFERTWNSWVSAGAVWPPSLEVPPLCTTMGCPPKRLMRWAGSLPWTTRTWKIHSKYALNRDNRKSCFRKTIKMIYSIKDKIHCSTVFWLRMHLIPQGGSVELTVWNVELKPTFPASFVVRMMTVGCSTPGGSRNVSVVTAKVLFYAELYCTLHLLQC